MTTDAQRDPRTQPVAGDVLRRADVLTERTVTERDCRSVFYTESGYASGSSMNPIGIWRAWARTATIDQP